VKRKFPTKEGSGMIVSDPFNPDRNPSFTDLVVRELEKLYHTARISHAIYSMAVDAARVQSKVLNNIYGRDVRGTERAVRFILNQLRK
jgi:hypothetical protein